MGRLVDADRFKRFLQALCKAGAPYYDVIQLLDKEPTAYDISKVVAELEEEKTMAYDNWDGGSSYQAYSQAIDIVRKGGVE